MCTKDVSTGAPYLVIIESNNFRKNDDFKFDQNKPVL